MCAAQQAFVNFADIYSSEREKVGQVGQWDLVPCSEFWTKETLLCLIKGEGQVET